MIKVNSIDLISRWHKLGLHDITYAMKRQMNDDSFLFQRIQTPTDNDNCSMSVLFSITSTTADIFSWSTTEDFIYWNLLFISFIIFVIEST